MLMPVALLVKVSPSVLVDRGSDGLLDFKYYVLFLFCFTVMTF